MLILKSTVEVIKKVLNEVNDTINLMQSNPAAFIICIENVFEWIDSYNYFSVEC
jgi:hypothetical protein